ncbi:ACR132Wp [Eremothecium gossypii ATCC 10895]|uniref:ACR132Wp n=1 Tax=Eremothecium gossypii (strain ATCC 10895 / CBS 109.51 / FGSC 9923 / NRRL Y-1056) TaxID=284811 RepID=Q75BY8_EREGS|nr:ACR132Wp [Eremothecium gossypii ATCC 10895]AAS51358.1 ACR132Wp [Eremothecium gossypii ATCC 10895]AEY95649.1 FACR132Wp [Eremothecium gossypii FDAG1]
MRLIGAAAELKEHWLWQPEVDRVVDVFDAPEATVMVFGVFYIDKFVMDVQDKIRKIHAQLEEVFRPWNEHYPWQGYSGVHLRAVRGAGGQAMVLGGVEVADNAEEEEALVAGVLQRFSRAQGAEVFIKMCDTEGDFLLMMSSEALPEEYDYPVGNNRLWLSAGEFKLIPRDVHGSRGLRANEAVDYLERSHFKCLTVPAVSRALEARIAQGFPARHLEALTWVHLKMRQTAHAELVRANPTVFPLLLANFLRNDLSLTGAAMEGQEAKCSDVHVLVPKTHAALASLLLAHSPVARGGDLGITLGDILSLSLQDALDAGQLTTAEPKGKLEGDLVSALVHTKQLERPVEFSTTELTTEVPTADKEASMDALALSLETFLTDIKDDDEGSNEHVSGQGSSAGDEEARTFFESEGVDISEDDFFEYFLTEGLKMNKEQLQHYRNGAYEDCANDDNAGSEHEEEDIMLEELHAMFGDKDGADGIKGIEQLFNSINLDGAPTGPLQAILKNMASHKKK